jgi:hypothetical protein
VRTCPDRHAVLSQTPSVPIKVVVAALLVPLAVACTQGGTSAGPDGPTGSSTAPSSRPSSSPSSDGTMLTAPTTPAGPSPSPSPARSSEPLPAELLAACGEPGTRGALSARYLVVEHEDCDLTGVVLAGHDGSGGCTVPEPGQSCLARGGIEVRTLDGTRDVTFSRTDPASAG